MILETLSTAKCHGGTQGVYRHASRATGTDMVFGLYLPPAAETGVKLPILYFLSGLTCTHANFIEKSGFQRVAAELGMIVVAPDTSPRGPEVADDPAFDLGQGAGFYVDATEEPFAKNYRMKSYIEEDLPELIEANFPADPERRAIAGHSMGGHGALTFALGNPRRWRSVSAFAPIVAPMLVPWGEKAFSAYLGPERAAWRRHDSVALIEDGARVPDILVDQGACDGFLDSQLKPGLLESACREAGIALTLRMRPGYDHSYYFLSSFIEDHLRWHRQRV